MLPTQLPRKPPRRGCSLPAEVEAQTPADRDRAIDVIRIVSLIGVVFGHTVMATSTIRDDVFIWSNLLTGIHRCSRR